jgi:hypothetical protein
MLESEVLPFAASAMVEAVDEAVGRNFGIGL